MAEPSLAIVNHQLYGVGRLIADSLVVGIHTAPGLSAETVAWIAAVIGAGGSVVGGAVGGYFALLVGRRQARQDRSDARTERSHQAALSVAHEIATLQEAVVAWKVAAGGAAQAGARDVRNVQRAAAIGQSMTDAARAVSELRGAFNEFSRSSIVQCIGLTDDNLRARVRDHARLAGLLCSVAENGGVPGPLLSETVQRHADAVLDAIDAHVNGRSLPRYAPLPPLEVNRAQELVDWRPQPATAERG